MRQHVPTTALAAALLVCTTGLAAQAVTDVTPAPCVPLDPFENDNNHAVVSATVEGASADSEVRLYYRRMHHVVEDFYYTVMLPDAGGNYWGVLPDPENREPKVFSLDDGTDTETEWADWWKAKESSLDRNPNGDLDPDEIAEKASVGASEARTWMSEMSNEELQAWLDELDNDPAEYFVAMYDRSGNRVAASDMFASIVETDGAACMVDSSPQQLGEQANMTVGETAEWQRGMAPFEWECTGIVTRIDPAGIKRGDESCRACVVALMPVWIPVAAAAAVVVAGSQSDSSTTVSPSEP